MDTIYLDHNATTPTRPEVIEAMARCYATGYANPASQHQPGQAARRVLEHARQRVAEILGADVNCLKPDRVIFTSGGTEANNLALLGMAEAQCPCPQGGHAGRATLPRTSHRFGRRTRQRAGNGRAADGTRLATRHAAGRSPWRCANR